MGPVGAAAASLDHRVEVDRWAWKLGRRGHQPGLELAGAAALADDEVAKDAGLGSPVEGCDAFPAGPAADRVAGRVVGLGGEQAVVDVDDLRPIPAAVIAERRRIRALAGPERVLELVAVAPLLDRGLDRLELEPVEAAEATQRVVHLPLLLCELALVRHPLPRRARAGLAAVKAAVGNPLGAAAQELDRLRLAVVPPRAHQARAHAIAGERARDEDDVAVGAGDPAPALGERVDLELEQLALPRPGRARGRGRLGHAPIVAALDRRSQIPAHADSESTIYFASRLSIASTIPLRALPRCSCVRTLRSSAGERSLSRVLIWAAVSSS